MIPHPLCAGLPTPHFFLPKVSNTYNVRQNLTLVSAQLN